MRDRHSAGIAGITGPGDGPRLRAMTVLWAQDLEESVRPQKLWLALAGLDDQSACSRDSSERHNAAMRRSVHGPGCLAELADRLDWADTAPKRLYRRRLREQQRLALCPVILSPASHAARLEHRQGGAWVSHERVEAAPSSANVSSNGELAP